MGGDLRLGISVAGPDPHWGDSPTHIPLLHLLARTRHRSQLTRTRTAAGLRYVGIGAMIAASCSSCSSSRAGCRRGFEFVGSPATRGLDGRLRGAQGGEGRADGTAVSAAGTSATLPQSAVAPELSAEPTPAPPPLGGSIRRAQSRRESQRSSALLLLLLLLLMLLL